MKFSTFCFLLVLGTNVIEETNSLPVRLRGNVARRSINKVRYLEDTSSADGVSSASADSSSEDRVLKEVRLLEDTSSTDGGVSSESADSTGDSSSED